MGEREPVRPINRIFNIVNRHSPILIQTPWPQHIGNCAEEIRYGVLKAQREGKRTLLVVHRHELFGRFRMRIANRELFLLESEDLYPTNSVLGWFGGWLLTGVLGLIRPWILLGRSEKLRRAMRRLVPWKRAPQGPRSIGVPTLPTIGLSRLWQTDGTNTFSWDVARALDWSGQYARYRPPRLADSKRRSAERLRVEMGIPLSDWFVALHVREAGDHEPDTVNYRNSSIGNYLDAIRVITEAGGWVVRLGDPSMTRLPEMARVVDYAHSRWKSGLMDLYLISECRFYFGTTSGPLEAALLLGRPTLTVNATELSIWGPMRPADLGILKHVYSPRLRRVLSVRELVEEPFESQSIDTLADSHGYQLIENSRDEIRDVLEEFMRTDRGPLSDLQLAFNAARSRAIRRWLDSGELIGFVDGEDEITEKYRLASVADARGSLGRKYLEQNWDTVPGWLTELPLATPAAASGSSEKPRMETAGPEGSLPRQMANVFRQPEITIG